MNHSEIVSFLWGVADLIRDTFKHNISYGSTLANDRHAGKTFYYLIANPPYGKDWKQDIVRMLAEVTGSLRV